MGKRISAAIKWIFNLEIYWQIIIGLVLGVLFGLLLPKYLVYIDWIGTLFMNGLKMLIVPLTFSSITSGVANIGSAKNFGRLGVKTMSFYIASSLFAIIVGQILVNIVQPGVGVSVNLTAQVPNIQSGSISDIILRIVPTNIISAFMEPNMLGIIFTAMVSGFFISRIETEQSQLLTKFFNSAFSLSMKITSFVLQFAPIGIFALMANVTVNNADNLSSLGTGLLKYSFVIIVGISIHFFVTLGLIIRYIGKVSPLKHFMAMRNALITAFTTCSSGATLPITMKCAEENLGVSKTTTSFVFPLSATINMDGTALYECVAAIYIAQAYGIDLTMSQQLLLTLTALLASIGAAAIPIVGLIMLSVVLSALNLPLEGIGLILVVDRFLDKFRTTNIYTPKLNEMTRQVNQNKHYVYNFPNCE